MRDWHPYRLEGQESNTKFYVNCQLADSDASRHIKCTVLQQEGVLSGEGSKPEEFMTKKYQQKAISSLQTCSSISFVTTEYYQYFFLVRTVPTSYPEPSRKPSGQCPSPCSELMLQRLGNSSSSELSVEQKPQKILAEVKNSAAWIMVKRINSSKLS